MQLLQHPASHRLRPRTVAAAAQQSVAAAALSLVILGGSGDMVLLVMVALEDFLQRVRMKVYGTQVSRRVQRLWATSPAARARFLPGMFRGR